MKLLQPLKHMAIFTAWGMSLHESLFLVEIEE